MAKKRNHKTKSAPIEEGEKINYYNLPNGVRKRLPNGLIVVRRGNLFGIVSEARVRETIAIPPESL